jgi:hypothetical protein
VRSDAVNKKSIQLSRSDRCAAHAVLRVVLFSAFAPLRQSRRSFEWHRPTPPAPAVLRVLQFGSFASSRQSRCSFERNRI